MGTLFEALVVGDDEEHLSAVAEAALDEVSRVERLLSRFDPASEIARINRQAAGGEVLLDVELTELLSFCDSAWRETDGAFDACAGSGHWSSVAFDAARRSICFRERGLRLDLGALGKGYALDRAAEIVRAFGVENALLHGGTSSILALGSGPDGRGWPVGVRDPIQACDSGSEQTELLRLSLADIGYSCSAVHAPGEDRSDIIDAPSGQPLVEQSAAVALAPLALEAELLSTAALVMGRERAGAYTVSRQGCSLGWVSAAGEPRCQWSGAPVHESLR
jgi:thiamine biosynthesis lipoprotein